MKRQLAFTFLLIAFCALGCKSGDNITAQNTVTDKALPAGWKKVEAEAGSISIDVPPGWKPIDLTNGEFEKMMADAGKNDPDLAKMESAIKSMAENKMFKLFIFHPPETGIAFAPTINLLEFDAPASATFDDLVKQNVQGMGTMTGGNDKTDPVTFENGDSGQVLKWTNHAQTGTETIDVDTWTYFLMKGHKFYVLTSGVPSKGSQQLHDELQSISKSLNTK